MYCTCKVTLKCVCATIVAVEEQCVTYFGFRSVTLRIQREMRVNHIVICGLFGSTVFFCIIS
jgi:hypothetical protein